VKVITTRFGEIEVDKTNIIEMSRGILGFEGLKSFTIISQVEKEPFMWLQSVEDGSVAFIVINPQLIKSDYEPEINDIDAAELHLEKSADAMLLTMVTVRVNPFSVTVNLRAPIIVNKTLRIARQIVLENENYPIRYRLSEKDQSASGNTETAAENPARIF
jgi:flagellar assembly factor FliW